MLTSAETYRVQRCPLNLRTLTPYRPLTTQDTILSGDVRVTLEYDMAAHLSGPRWLDDYQMFNDVTYEPGLVVLVDIRY